MRNGDSETSRRQPAPRPARKAPQVLLVEDDEAMRSMLAQALGQAGYRVTECSDGWQWLRYCLRKAAVSEQGGDGGEEYDVVVSDIRMPNMGGLEVLRILNSRDCAVHCPPTIFITAFGDEETHAKARSLGAAGVLDKPFSISDLIERIRAVAAPLP